MFAITQFLRGASFLIGFLVNYNIRRPLFFGSGESKRLSDPVSSLLATPTADKC